METKGLVALGISLASPEKMRSWSHGEVLKPETINYRRLRPEKDGLFCEAIFGPTRDYQCYCGKYKNPRYKGIVCEKCGVEVTKSSVRRERLGHIELATHIAHIWYTRRIPSYLGLLLDISRRSLDRVLYFAQYIVTNVDEDAKQRALEKLEEEISGSERELGQEINKKILDVKSEKEKKIAQINAEAKALEDAATEKTAESIQPVISEAQRLENQLSQLMGQAAPSEIKFETVDLVIAGTGDVISNKHITMLQNAAKAKTEAIEKEYKSENESKLQDLSREKDKVSADAMEQIEALQKQLTDRADESESENARLREELQDIQPFAFLSETQYHELRQHYGQVFKADMGADAFYDILTRLNLDQLSEDLWKEIRTTKSKQKRKKAVSRLKVVESFRVSGNHPEWMILKVLPVIPPDLRPMVQLDGGRFATSDLNDLYRRVINRNNRLKRLLELGAPDVIVRNEKRMLQEAVDSLIDNSQRGKALSRRGRRELKSLSDMLKGKKGRFRRNLLGKRVDYSGRSVIVVGPKLTLDQCGLPKTMALELYHPFVVSKLVEQKLATNVKGASRLIQRNKPEVWGVLADVIKNRPVLLNRAPTLHRLSIQAFHPILIEGNAIQLHPLVTTAFNADFDGDQMSVHVPLSDKAVKEAEELMLSTKNLLKPASGDPIISPSKDMVLGIYYLTMNLDKDNLDLANDPMDGDREYSSYEDVKKAYDAGEIKLTTKIKFTTNSYFDDKFKKLSKPVSTQFKTTVERVLYNMDQPEKERFHNEELLGELRAFTSFDDVQMAYDLHQVKLHTRVRFYTETYFDEKGNRLDQPEKRGINTTVGRVLFNYIIPATVRFKDMPFTKSDIKNLIAEVYQNATEETTAFVDRIKDIGFEYAMRSGCTVAVSDIVVPKEKKQMIEEADNNVQKLQKSWNMGQLSDEEKKVRVIKIWEDTTDAMAEAVKKTMDPQGEMAIMSNSGASKGGYGPISQLAGMRGVMVDPTGQKIELPIKSNFREGLTALEFFISTHGSRKGLSDTALRTADAGYLTRRLVDIAQDLIINEEDCGTDDGIYINRADIVAQQNFSSRIFSRVTAEQIIDPKTGEILLEKGDVIDHAAAKRIEEDVNITTVKVRSPMTCKLKHGICAKCYGLDLGRGEMVKLGTAVGIVAAQSIGEPGTQLTLRTFHSGGVAAQSDITKGLPRVEELFEARRTPKGEAVITKISGTAKLITESNSEKRIVRVENSEMVYDTYVIPEGAQVLAKDGDDVEIDETLMINGDVPVNAKNAGKVRIENGKMLVTYENHVTEDYDIPATARLKKYPMVRKNEQGEDVKEELSLEKMDSLEVTAGTPLTEGSLNPHSILKLQGRDACMMYILKEIQDVYHASGESINDKHFEVIIRKMLGKVQITSSGDTPFLPMDVVDGLKIRDLNAKLVAEGKTPAKYVDILLGVTKASLSTDSWLAASSFQHTIKVLASAAINGARDPLYGLKENVIIGKLIPAGTGFVPGRFTSDDDELMARTTLISNIPTE